MKRFLRIFLTVLTVLAVLLIGGVWYLSRWLKSPETKSYVEQELSKALKMPLKFQALTISLWSGVRAEGVSVQDGGTQFFESTSFVAKHRIAPLLGGRFVFSEVTIDSPRFVLVQRPDGSWKLPELPQEPKPEKKPEERKEPSTPKPQGTPKPKKKDADVMVEKLMVSNGVADLFDKDHKPVASLSGLAVSLKDVQEDNLEGWVRADKVVWNGKFAVTNFIAGVSNSEEKGFIIPEFSAKAGGGTLKGGFARKAEKPPKYSAKLKVTDVELAQTITDAGVEAPNLSGLLSANIEVRGTGNDTKQMSGKAQVDFRNGTCREIEMVQEIGTMLQLEEIANFGIPSAKADVVIWNGRLSIKPLSIDAPPLGVTAEGTAKLDGKLDLKANLLARADFLAKNPAVAAQFGPPDARGMRALPFNVEGTLTKPKHNLKERVTGTKDKSTQRAIMIEAATNAILNDLQPGKPGAEKKPDVKP